MKDAIPKEVLEISLDLEVSIAVEVYPRLELQLRK